MNFATKAGIVFITVLVFTSCGFHINKFPEIKIEDYPTVRFCELPNYEKDTVFVRGKYFGVEEYWNFTAVEKSCQNLIDADLDIVNGFTKMTPKIEEKFKNIHSNYWDGYLLIDAVGIFESNGSFGHLGSKNSRFLVIEIVNAELVKNR